MSSSSTPGASLEHVAGNGLLHRRIFLTQGVALVSAGGLTVLSAESAAAADPPDIPSWMRAPGAGMSGYGSPAKYEHQVQRAGIDSQPGTTGSGASRTPLERLNGMITPSGLHFERHHGGVPDIDPDAHRLLIHGMVKRPLVFTMDALLRYPMVSRIQFIECSGNSRPNLSPAAPAASCGAIHGLVSCSEWTGVPLAIVLAEAGADASAQWLLAEGADAAAMSRSVPMAKAMEDALLAFYQNGERLRPENGYPVRLFLPGYEGNMSVKWLRRIKVTAGPTMTKDETSKYTDLLASGKSLMFTYPMESQVGHHRPVTGPRAEGAGALRDLGARLVGPREDHEGGSVSRRRPNLGRGGAGGSSTVEGADAVPNGVEMGRRAGRAQEPLHRRDRRGPADTRQARGRQGYAVPLPLQRHPGLECSAEW
jgi:sulfane dehydrogenase subunit SoxC